MAERFKAAVLKTVERKLRGFESLSLRQIFMRISEWIRKSTLQILFILQLMRKLQSKVKYGEVAERLKAAAC